MVGAGSLVVHEALGNLELAQHGLVIAVGLVVLRVHLPVIP